MGKVKGGVSLGGRGDQVLCLENVEFNMFNRYLDEDVKQEVGYIRLGFKGYIWVQI